jgi:peptide/nickel transport system ATP-binding protein
MVRQGPTSRTTRSLLVVEDLVKEDPRTGVGGSLNALFKRNSGIVERKSQAFCAVDGISFIFLRGEGVGRVGKSGCGKSTTSTLVMRLIDATGGRPLRSPGYRRHSRPQIRSDRPPVAACRWCSRIRPTAPTRASRGRAIADPIIRLGDINGSDAVRAL